MAAATSASAASLKEYLKRYESSGAAADDQKKKKKRKPKPNPVGTGVLVVDEDPVWQKPIQPEGIDDDDSAEETPQVEEDIEVKRMRRLETIRSLKPYNAISEDGSGWVSVSNPLSGDLSPPPKSQEDPDLSPPRLQKKRFDKPSRRGEEPDDRAGDLSLPHRRKRRFDTPEPEMRGDLSPPRRRSPEADEPRGSPGTDISPPRRHKRDSSGDPSRPRGAHRHSQEPTERQGSGAVDLSPRRSRRKDSHEDDLSPPRRRRRESAADLSPPRRARGRLDTPASDLSPPRRNQKNSSGGLSLPQRHDPLETSRTAGSGAADLSPPRKMRKEPSVAKEELKTGLLSAKEIKDEIDKKKKAELARYASLDPSLSGKGAAPVFRDKEGKRITKEEILKAQEEEKPKEKNLEWGKGLAQKRESEAKAHELELEKDKPFARTRDDPELDTMLKERIRWGDPMAHLVKRKQSEAILEDLGDDEKMKESGFIIPQTIPNHSWIKRGLDFPPNRYGIRPGRHWDGVDRSTGYEKDLVKRENDKRATQAEAYLWSVADM